MSDVKFSVKHAPIRHLLVEAGVPNKNGRIYPIEVLQAEIDRLKNQELLGELDPDSMDSIIYFSNVSHRVNLILEADCLYAEIHVLQTPCGKILQQLINDKVHVKFAMRGIGNGKVNEDGHLVIDSSYKLITVDAVAGD